MKTVVTILTTLFVTLPAHSTPTYVRCSHPGYEFSAEYVSSQELKNVEFTWCAPDFCTGPEESMSGPVLGKKYSEKEVPGYKFEFAGGIPGTLFIPEEIQQHNIHFSIAGSGWVTQCNLENEPYCQFGCH